MVTLSQVKPYRERLADGGLRLNMHRGQKRAMDSQARFPIILAGLQSGKTCLSPDWLLREIGKRGPGDYFAATASFPLLDKKLLPEFKEIFINIYRLGEYMESKKELRFHDGKTRIFFLSADSPEASESMTALGGVMDEAGQNQFRRDTWVALQGRVSLNQGRILMATSLYNHGWLKREVYDRAMRGDRDYEIIQFESIMNPAFPLGEWERMKRSLPPWEFNMRYRGVYDRSAGMVYDSFNEEQCKVKRFPIPPNWLVYVGHDFGMANTAAVFYAQNPGSGDYFLFQTYKPGPGRSTAQHVAEWQRIVKGMQVLRRVGGSHQEEEIRQGYTAQGWPIAEPYITSVHEGILRVYALHSANRINVFDDLYDYLDEKGRYSWKLGADLKPTEEIEDKASYHLLDAERYVLGSSPRESIRGAERQAPMTRKVAWV